MIYTGGDEIRGIMLGSDEIQAIYAGEELIYPMGVSGFTVKPLAISFAVGGGSKNIKITSEYAWTAVVSDSWITLSTYSGDSGRTTIVATVGENETGEEISGTVIVTSTDLQHTATVDIVQQTSPIPAEYQEIQYIYNQSQIAYIPTDIYFTSDMWFEFKVRNLGVSQLPERHIFGGSLFDTQVQTNAASWFIRGNRTSTQRAHITNAFPANTDVTAVLYKGNDNIVLNGVNYASLTPKGTTDTYKAYFFTNNQTIPQNNDADRLGLNAYLYYYIIGSNTSGEELYHFVPVRRKSDNLVGLYEIINGAFYGPGNSNTFVAGPDV